MEESRTKVSHYLRRLNQKRKAKPRGELWHGDDGYPEALEQYYKTVRADATQLADRSFQPGLCSRCRGINWEKFAKTEIPVHEALVFDISESFGDLSRSSCELCRFISSVSISEGDTDRLFPARDVNACMAGRRFRLSDGSVSHPLLFQDSSALCLEAHYSPCTQAHAPPRDATCGDISCELLRAWLALCDTSHGPSCHSNQSIDFRGFMVIDCTTNITVPAPVDCEYVALSYLWGTTVENRSEEDKADFFPTTIRDSITLTLSLGFKYLWVDRYVRWQLAAGQAHP